MSDDRGRDRVDELRARIVTQQQTGELVVFHQRNRVTVLAVLHWNAHAISEKLSDIDRIPCHLDRRNQTLGRYQRARRSGLPRREPIADDRVAGNVEWRDAIEEIFLARFEQREI